ncbi:MAG: hypothetical protein HY689_06955 [Chloroflexi bacterium]|nr:hypothetical protein [Chloroflexota bacterium]
MLRNPTNLPTRAFAIPTVAATGAAPATADHPGRLPGAVRTVLRAGGAVALGLVLLLIGQAAALLQEAPTHSVVYAALVRGLEPRGLDLIRPPYPMTFADHPSAAELRDRAFAWFAIRPEARAWMQDLPISYASSTTWSGRYQMDSRSVSVAQPSLEVVLHEYAHANLHQKPAREKVGALLGMVRLLLDRDPRHQPARAVLRAVLADGAAAMRRGRSYSLLHEAYAYLAQWTGGDLVALPDYLQPAYADYLTPGPNRWLQWQAQQGRRMSPSAASAPRSPGEGS